MWVRATSYSAGRDSAELMPCLPGDDLYTDHDSNAHHETTFVSNHDDGRLGLFLTKTTRE